MVSAQLYIFCADPVEIRRNGKISALEEHSPQTAAFFYTYSNTMEGNYATVSGISVYVLVRSLEVLRVT